MPEMLQSLAANATDFLVYLAIALVALTGIAKCVLPVRRSARRLRRGIHALEASAGDTRPVWQDALFLGKSLQGAWRRFLVNAEQLDARGLNCNVEDYINDDTVIYSVGHVQLAEVVPSLLTSLGILGTFIGLMRGLSGLDLNDAAKTMESIPQMIGGMTYAFTTSIAGVACSLIFNMLNRTACGSAVRAIDDFNDAFTDLVMQKPLDDSVQMICQQEDQAAMMRRMGTELSSRVSEGILSSVEQSLTPVAQSMNQFILGQTQAQIDGVNTIATQFVAQMNRSLNNQFVQLGQTLSAVNQAQHVSFESLDRTMAAADQILSGMNQLQSVTQRVMERFEGYISTIEQAQDSNGAFLTHGSQVLSGMITASQEQTDFLKNLKDSQLELKKTMQEYAVWSTGVLNTVREQNEGSLAAAGKIAGQMEASGQKLADHYTSFVEDISTGFSRALGLFDENMHSVLTAMGEKLEDLKEWSGKAPDQAARYQKETEGCITAVSRLQRALTDMSAALEKGKDLAEEP